MSAAIWKGTGDWSGWRIEQSSGGKCELVSGQGHRTPLPRLVRVETPKAPQETETRGKRLSVRLLADEYDRVKERAEQAGLSTSDYIRSVLQAQP